MVRTLTKKMDIINGPIVKNIIFFAIPIFLTSSFQQLFNAADIIVCGKFVGSTALAAVGANTQIINLFINSFMGLSIGANVLIANYIGAGKTHKIHNVVHTAMTFAFIFGFILMIVGLLFSRNILLFLGTPSEILIAATVYLQIIFMAIPFIVVYNFGAAILRSIGDTRRPLIILTFTGMLNVVMNVFFVVFFGLGVTGVALATAIANVINAIVVVVLLIREKSDIKYNIKEWIIVPDSLYKIMKIGIPSAISGMVFSTSNLCVQSAINSLGTKTIAANTAALNIESFTFYITTAFSQACLTILSQNYGAEKFGRCKKIVKACIFMAMLFIGIIILIIKLFTNQFLLIFTNDIEVIEIAKIRLGIVTALSFIQPIYEIYGSALRVLRHPYIQTVAVIFGIIVFRVLWVFTVFPVYPNYVTICAVYPISWAILIVFMFTAYMTIGRKMLRHGVV